jgi:hypothetical protein
MEKPPLPDSDLERQPTRGRIAYAPDVDAQIQARMTRTNTRRSRSRSRDSMSIRRYPLSSENVQHTSAEGRDVIIDVLTTPLEFRLGA